MHQLSEETAVWLWDTDVFEVRILGDVHSCYYTITDKWEDPAKPRIIGDGRTASFHQAENRVREMIGKAYPESLGYRKYAGHLATTFMIANGTYMDFGPYEGKAVTIEVYTNSETTSAISGELRIDNYYLAIVRGKTHITVRPTHVKSLTVMRAGGEIKADKVSGRTYRGKWEDGCTGTPGFLSGTVDHADTLCPIHES